MKVSFLLIFTITSLNCFSQTVKSSAKQPVKTKVSENNQVDPLKQEDFKYYFLANRNNMITSEHTKENYTLKVSNEYFGKASDFSGEWVILDVRTGKEVAFWPHNVENYFSKKNQQIYAYNNNKGYRFSLMHGFTSSGKFIYKEEMSTKTSSLFGSKNFSLSTDFKKAVFSFNNDLWVSDFDITKGTISTPLQSTFNGLMKNAYFYMKGDDVLAVGSGFGSESRLINLKTKKIKDLNQLVDFNNYITDYLYNGSIDDRHSGKLVSITTHEFIMNKRDYHFVFWLDNLQTKYLVLQSKPDRSKILKPNSYYLHNLNKNGEIQQPDTNPLLLDWPNAVKINLHHWYVFFSPNKKFFMANYNESIPRPIYLYDLNSFEEIRLNMNIDFLKSKPYWIDDYNFIIYARPGDIINGDKIIEGTQGTYHYNVETKTAKKITPYLINETEDAFHLDKFMNIAIGLHDSGYAVFNANNLLFRIKSDGTELTPLTKYPGLYSLRTAFITPNSDLE